MLPGTCEGACGGQSNDRCWCDDLCDGYGDCCSDYAPVCLGEPPAGSCEGFCGERAPDGCWCNERCVEVGDCCEDYEAQCVEDPPPVDPGDDPWSELSDSALINALNDETSSDHSGLSYNNARDYIYGVTGSGIDIHNNSIEGIYTGITATPDGSRTPGTLNTEHSWPRSDGADVFPREGDLHHLFPTDTDANSERSNLQFGETTCTGGGCTWSEGGSELGANSSGTTVFQVRAKYQGDVARAHFYFSVRYGLSIPNSEEAVLRAWHEQDPVSQQEQGRNDAIEAVQGNRNPFVDYPHLPERISDF